MSRARQNIVVEVTTHPGSPDVNPLDLEELVKAVCKRFDVSNATVGIAIVDDAGFREINSRFLNRKSTSDCLSFDLSEEGQPHGFVFHIGGSTRTAKRVPSRQ